MTQNTADKHTDGRYTFCRQTDSQDQMAQPSPGGQAIQIIVQINVFSFSQTISQQIYAMIEDKWNVRPFLGCDFGFWQTSV